jgi:hypothetical protein
VGTPETWQKSQRKSCRYQNANLCENSTQDVKLGFQFKLKFKSKRKCSAAILRLGTEFDLILSQLPYSLSQRRISGPRSDRAIDLRDQDDQGQEDKSVWIALQSPPLYPQCVMAVLPHRVCVLP